MANRKNLDLLSYEAYIANLNDSLKFKVSHSAAISSYTKYPECQKKLPYLEKSLSEKVPKLKNIFIDYGIFTPDVKSYHKDEDLFLNCSKDSIEEMKDVINTI